MNFLVICGLVGRVGTSSRHIIHILYTAESLVGKGQVIKGYRRHARRRFGKVEYFHCHYFVRLEEGTPPKNYYQNAPKEPQQQLADWLASMRKRKINNSL